MENSPHRFTCADPAIGVVELARYAEGWLLAGDISQHSQCTVYTRSSIVRKLLWFLQRRACETCGTLELRQFLAHLTNGHKEPGGRWGNPRMNKPVRPRTVHTYHGHLRTFFRWLVTEGAMPSSPMDRIPVPVSRSDQIQPFTQEQLKALLAAARRSRYARRDEAILLFLLDTALRASELCAIRMQDVDLSGKRCIVLGKGNKYRTVPFSAHTARSLWSYLKDEKREPEDPLFTSERSEALTRSGLLQLLERLGKAARIEVTRCSPHTLRHTSATEYLRAGGNVFTLQQILGHTTLHMTNRYVALAQADIENQHRHFSPVARLKGGKR